MRPLFFIFYWFIYFPTLRVLVLLLFWSEKVESRERFEKKNKFEAWAQSFREKSIVADLCFEFSSEGEYQQVAPLIDDALIEGKKVELVFFSPSVEKAIMTLAQRYPGQVRYLRFPLVRLFPFIERRSFTHWVTAKTLIMVRYDLFPDIFLWGLTPGNTLKFVWFTFKKERVSGKSVSLWKKLFLKNADSIVYASHEDLIFGKSLSFPGVSYDFRVEQIRRRVIRKEEKFKNAFPLYPKVKELWDRYPQNKRLIIGNAWPSDLFLLKNLPSDIFVLVVPHQLSEEILEDFREVLTKLNCDFFEIDQKTTEVPSKGVILLNKKGVLCELYADFGRSYVGGGFHGSVHSILEPLVAGSSHISSGPMHARSTEYDMAMELGRMTEVNTPEQFNDWLNSHVNRENFDKMDELFKNYEKMKNRVISC